VVALQTVSDSGGVLVFLGDGIDLWRPEGVLGKDWEQRIYRVRLRAWVGAY